jgi:cytochrome P450
MTNVATGFDIFDPVFRADPYPAFRRLRATSPVLLDPGTGICWLFRHADCEEALRDPRLGSPLGSPEVLARKLGDGAAACYIGTSMLAQNPPQHTRLRRAVSKAFTAKAVETRRDAVVAKVNALLDEVTAGGRKEFDLANEVAYRIPISVVCGMLGVPPEHHDRFRSLLPGWPPNGGPSPATTCCRCSSPTRTRTAGSPTSSSWPTSACSSPPASARRCS